MDDHVEAVICRARDEPRERENDPERGIAEQEGHGELESDEAEGNPLCLWLVAVQLLDLRVLCVCV